MKFRWQGIDSSGHQLSGTFIAASKQDAIDTLCDQHILITTIKRDFSAISHIFQKKISSQHIEAFTQQLQLLLASGLSLSSSLLLIEKIVQHSGLKNLAKNLHQKIQEGLSFSDALNFFPQQFNDYYRQLIATGEKSDQLNIVLLALNKHQTQQRKLKRKIKKSLLYPCCVLSLAILISIGLLLFVVPQFSAIYANFNGQLPKITQRLVTVSAMMSNHGGTIAIIIATVCYLLKKSVHKNKVAKLALHIPGFQSLITAQILMKWTQLLSLTLSSRIPLTQALLIANQAIHHPILQRDFDKIREAVMTGESLHRALNHCAYIPITMKEMVAVAENADTLDRMMNKIAKEYQRALQDKLGRLSKLVEPVMMIGVAGIVAMIILALYLPIFQMRSVL